MTFAWRAGRAGTIKGSSKKLDDERKEQIMVACKEGQSSLDSNPEADAEEFAELCEHPCKDLQFEMQFESKTGKANKIDLEATITKMRV